MNDDHDALRDALTGDPLAAALASHPDEPKRAGSVRTLRRACMECRRDYAVNLHHITAHKFCSAACRSRSRHRACRPITAPASSRDVLAVDASPVPVEVASVAQVPAAAVPPPAVEDHVLTPGCEWHGDEARPRSCAYCAALARAAALAG